MKKESIVVLLFVVSIILIGYVKINHSPLEYNVLEEDNSKILCEEYSELSHTESKIEDGEQWYLIKGAWESVKDIKESCLR